MPKVPKWMANAMESLFKRIQTEPYWAEGKIGL